MITYHIICLQCLYKWIQLQQEEMTKAGESNVELIIDHYVQHILPLVRYKFKPLFLTWTKKSIVLYSIRFAMMTSSQLAQLLLNPLSVTHTDLLLRRARIGIASPFTTNVTHNSPIYNECQTQSAWVWAMP